MTCIFRKCAMMSPREEASGAASRPRRPGAERPRFSRQAKCVLCLPRVRAIRRANRAGADTRPRPHANARGNRVAPMPGSPCRTQAERKEPPHPVPVIQPAVALSTRQEAFRNHYHDKIQVNMSFHDMPQQPARPAGVVPDGAKQPAPAHHAERPRFSRQARCALCLPRARAIRCANRAGADTRPRPHANARGKGSPMPGRSAG